MPKAGKVGEIIKMIVKHKKTFSHDYNQIFAFTPECLSFRDGDEDAGARGSYERAAAERGFQTALRGPDDEVPTRGYGLQAVAEELQVGPNQETRRRPRQIC